LEETPVICDAEMDVVERLHVLVAVQAQEGFWFAIPVHVFCFDGVTSEQTVLPEQVPKE
jgi:hypothetical protein